MTETISAAAAPARETSRTRSGQLGTQPLSEAEIDDVLAGRRDEVLDSIEDHFEITYEQRADQSWVTFGGTDEVDEIRKGLLTESLAACGLDLKDPRNAAAVEELLSEGRHNHHDVVKPELSTYNDVADLAPGATDKRLTFTDPTVLPIDTMNGSGYVTRVYGQVVVEVPTAPERKSFYIDANAPGYGWDANAGVVPSSYRAP